MEKLFTITGIILWIVICGGTAITGITLVGCAIYNWNQSYEYVCGNRLKRSILRILSPVADGVTFVYYYLTFTDEQKKEVARLSGESRYKPRGYISKTFIRYCVNHAKRESE